MAMQTTLSTAALLALALITVPAAMAQTTPETNKPWCGDVDGSKECVYNTVAECERWMRPEGHLCLPNPRGGELDD
jgi:hypothetical protein